MESIIEVVRERELQEVLDDFLDAESAVFRLTHWGQQSVIYSSSVSSQHDNVIHSNGCGLSLLRQGRCTETVHDYFRRFESRKCCLGLVGGQNIRTRLRLVHSDSTSNISVDLGVDAVAQPSSSPHLSNEEFRAYKCALWCTVCPLLTAQRPPDETSPILSPLEGSSRSLGLARSNEEDDASQLQLARGTGPSDLSLISADILRDTLRQAFGLSKQSEVYYVKQAYKAHKTKNDAQILAEDLVYQLSLLEKNSNPYYNVNFFLFRKSYDLWRHKSRKKIMKLINKFWSGAMLPVGEMAKYDASSIHADYRLVLHKLLRHEHRLRRKSGADECAALCTMPSGASLKIVTEFCLRYGIDEIYQESMYLDYLTLNFDVETRFIEKVIETILNILKLLPSDKTFALLVKQQVDQLIGCCEMLIKRCEHLFSHIQMISLSDNSNQVIGLLIQLLEQILSLQSYLSSNSATPDVLLQQYLEVNFQLVYNDHKMAAFSDVSNRSRSSVQLSPRVINRIMSSLRDDMVDYKSNYHSIFARYMDLSRKASVALYDCLMNDVKRLCEDFAKFDGQKKVDFGMIGLIYRLNFLDLDWKEYISVGMQTWRQFYADLIIHWFSDVFHQTEIFLLNSISLDHFIPIHSLMRRSFSCESELSNVVAPDNLSLHLSLVPSRASAFSIVSPSSPQEFLADDDESENNRLRNSVSNCVVSNSSGHYDDVISFDNQKSHVEFSITGGFYDSPDQDEPTQASDAVILGKGDSVPASKYAVPKLDDALPGISDVTSGSMTVLPRLDEIKSESNDANPGSDEIKSESNDANPGSDEIKSEYNDANPRMKSELDDVKPAFESSLCGGDLRVATYDSGDHVKLEVIPEIIKNIPDQNKAILDDGIEAIPDAIKDIPGHINAIPDDGLEAILTDSKVISVDETVRVKTADNIKAENLSLDNEIDFTLKITSEKTFDEENKILSNVAEDEQHKIERSSTHEERLIDEEEKKSSNSSEDDDDDDDDDDDNDGKVKCLPDLKLVGQVTKHLNLQPLDVIICPELKNKDNMNSSSLNTKDLKSLSTIPQSIEEDFSKSIDPIVVVTTRSERKQRQISSSADKKRKDMTIPITSSVIDVLVMLQRLTHVVETLGGTLYGSVVGAELCQNGKDGEAENRMKELTVNIKENLSQMISKLVCLYSMNLLAMDVCALQQTIAIKLVGSQLIEDLLLSRNSIWGCRHKLYGTDCLKYLNRDEEFGGNRFEPLSKEMCLRINNLLQLQKTLDSFYVKCSILWSSKLISLDENAGSMQIDDKTGSLLLVTKNYVKNVINGLINVLVHRMQLFISDFLNRFVMFKLPNRNKLELTLQPLNSFLIDHLKSMKRWFYSDNYLMFLDRLSLSLSDCFEKCLEELQRKPNSFSEERADLLLQTIAILMRTITKLQSGIDKMMVELMDSVMFRLQLYSQPTRRLISIYQLIVHKRLIFSRDTMTSSTDCLDVQLLERMKNDLHSSRKCFKGNDLIEWITSKQSQLLRDVKHHQQIATQSSLVDDADSEILQERNHDIAKGRRSDSSSHFDELSPNDLAQMMLDNGLISTVDNNAFTSTSSSISKSYPSLVCCGKINPIHDVDNKTNKLHPHSISSNTEQNSSSPHRNGISSTQICSSLPQPCSILNQNGSSLAETDSSLAQNGTSLAETDSSLAQNGSSLAETDSSVARDVGSGLVQNDSSYSQTAKIAQNETSEARLDGDDLSSTEERSTKREETPSSMEEQSMKREDTPSSDDLENHSLISSRSSSSIENSRRIIFDISSFYKMQTLDEEMLTSYDDDLMKSEEESSNYYHEAKQFIEFYTRKRVKKSTLLSILASRKKRDELSRQFISSLPKEVVNKYPWLYVREQSVLACLGLLL